MELHQLRSFIAIAKEGNLTRASNVLCLSQPAVSAQLRALEEELRIQLFVRTPKGMTLTRAGELLLDEANLALQAADTVVSRANALTEQVVGEVSLGTISEPVALRLGGFLSSILAQHPGLKVQLNQYVSGEVIEKVLSRELDAGYVIGGTMMPGLSMITLSPITLHVVGPVEWGNDLSHASWEKICRYPWIGTSPKCSFTQVAERVFREHNVRPCTIVETDQESILRNLVSSGVGLCLLREDQAIAAEKAGEIYIWRGGDAQSSLQFVYRTMEINSPLMKAILSVVNEVWNL